MRWPCVSRKRLDEAETRLAATRRLAGVLTERIGELAVQRVERQLAAEWRDQQERAKR